MRGSAISSIIAIAMSFLVLFMSAEWIIEVCSENPLRFISFTLAVLLTGGVIGFAVGCNPARTEHAVEKAKAKEAEKRAAKEQAAIEAEMRRHIDALDRERLDLLKTIRFYGIYKTEYGSTECQLLEGLAALDLVAGSGGFIITWQLSKTCRKIMEEMDR